MDSLLLFSYVLFEYLDSQVDSQIQVTKLFISHDKKFIDKIHFWGYNGIVQKKNHKNLMLFFARDISR